MTNVYMFLLSSILTLGITIADIAQQESPTTTAATTTAPTVKLEENTTTLPLPSSTVVVDSTILKKANSSEAALKESNETTPLEDDDIPDDTWTYENTTVVDSRRILISKETKPNARPYMVYLQLTRESAKVHHYHGWICGGVIINIYFVLTSGACAEDADHFYIISGITKYVDGADYKSHDCVRKHRRRAVWKSYPKNYKFDFMESHKWSSNDVAVVKVDRPFNIGEREMGCDFPVDIISYNNISRALETPGTKGYIAGWGSGGNFREGVYRRQTRFIPDNANYLQEAKVYIMDIDLCADKYPEEFQRIIEEYMICTMDIDEKKVIKDEPSNCTDVKSNRRLNEAESPKAKSMAFNVDLGRHLRDPNDYTARRLKSHGGFCENDHGGPLIVTHKKIKHVIGIISACKIDPDSHSCYGPFLYTSVYKNRKFISCVINKDIDESCRRKFRRGITHEEWHISWDNYNEEDDDK